MFVNIEIVLYSYVNDHPSIGYPAILRFIFPKKIPEANSGIVNNNNLLLDQSVTWKVIGCFWR